MVLSMGCVIRSCSLFAFAVFVTVIVCVQGDCGPPPVIEHTQPITETTFPIDSTIAYDCDRSSGYYEIPNKIKTITCQGDSTWTQIPEFCTRACEPPPRITFAELQQTYIDMNIFLNGTVVQYNCKPGYRRKPGTSTSITCLDDFTWSPYDTFCERRSCQHPGEVANGDLEFVDFLFGSRVTYTCNLGYRMTTKRNYRDCLASGTWSGALPDCEVQICPPPATVDNGRFHPEKEVYEYLNAITYECDKGFDVVGEASIHCTEHGTWSSSAPDCKNVVCEDPSVSESSRLSGFVGPYHLNHQVTFKCKEGLIMNGSSSVKCNIDSQWEPALPECLDGCYAPPVKPFEELQPEYSTQAIFRANSKVEYSCIPGYESKSLNTRKCEGKLQWNPQKTLCEAISCRDPPMVQGGNHLGGTFTFGTTVTYKCDKGYKMTSESNVLACQADRSWGPKLPVCDAIICPSLHIPNGTLKPLKNEYKYMDSVSIRCSGMLHQIGKKMIRCQEDGTWDSDIPQCKAFICVIPKDQHFADLMDISGERIHYFDVKLQCETGYTLKGASDVKCSFSGQWESALPSCEHIHNPIPLIIGIVVGCVLVILLVLIVIMVWKKKHSGKPEPDLYNAHYKACDA
uniref:Sushi domain-containing protein n=1 Tax=Leptobrachium leishanense TaxID=445787 RepID=A0A8C5MNE1_9ANUR